MLKPTRRYILSSPIGASEWLVGLYFVWMPCRSKSADYTGEAGRFSFRATMVPTNELDSAVLLSQPRRAVDMLWGMPALLTIATHKDSHVIRRQLDQQYGDLRGTRDWDQARCLQLTADSLLDTFKCEAVTDRLTINRRP